MGYYMGDFYQGDPGILDWGRRILGFGVSAIPGIGPIASKAVSVLGKAARHPAARAVGGAVLGAGATAGAERLMGPPRQGFPGKGMGGVTMMPGGPGVKGFHMSKPYKCHGVIVPSHMVRNRRMRVTNPKALRRSIRRAHGFARLAKKVLHFTSPRAPRGRPIFKRRRKKAA